MKEINKREMFRVYVEQKKDFQQNVLDVKQELSEFLDISIQNMRILDEYASEQIFSESIIYTLLCDGFTQDVSFDFSPENEEKIIRIQMLPAQFNPTQYWAEKGALMLGKELEIEHATIFVFTGITEEQRKRIANYLINPLESAERELGDFSKAAVLTKDDLSFVIVEDFFEKSAEHLQRDYQLGLAVEDIEFLQEYLQRAPYLSELQFLETYWSDHCRHTTFLTKIEPFDKQQIPLAAARESFNLYEKHRGLQKLSLMDLALFPKRLEKEKKNLEDLVQSDEINAATIVRKIAGKDIEIVFKNETHNHPTEIEPFGGAATCLGGAIRDPLSARAFVYQAMRITAGAYPLSKDKLPGKLYQRQIAKGAARGFSSYGNQIGLATGYVREYYHPDFVAKRLECGFVIGVGNPSVIRREKPSPGDVLVLLGGRTGIDGVGGASGSSQSHDQKTTRYSGSEVQKGNAPEERKLIRLFNNDEFVSKIKRCNDLGAGGISVGFGEIAEGLEIELNTVPTKVEKIKPVEILLSESQERMAIVVQESDLDCVLEMARYEHVQATPIGRVTKEPHFVVKYNGDVLLDLSRELLNTNGASRRTNVEFSKIEGVIPNSTENEFSPMPLLIGFDHTIGSGCVLNSLGGIRRKSPSIGMVSLIPVPQNHKQTSICTSGFQPEIGKWSAFHGAYYAVIESLSKSVVLGGDYQDARFSFQEYFKKMQSAKDFGLPMMSLLGANTVLHHFNLASIGGKDSMSGSFHSGEKEYHVPPSFISFCVNTSTVEKTIANDFKGWGNDIVLFYAKKDKEELLDLEELQKGYDRFMLAREEGQILSASVVSAHLHDTINDMAIGSGVNYFVEYDRFCVGAIVAEMKRDSYKKYQGIKIGETIYGSSFYNRRKVDRDQYAAEKIKKSAQIYSIPQERDVQEYEFMQVKKKVKSPNNPRAVIPVFEGTNCEYDLQRVLLDAGADVRVVVFDSTEQLAGEIDQAGMLVLAGGFSASDEPKGSAKLMAAALRHQKTKKAFEDLLARGGLVLGICNGFQTLVKLGVFQNDKIEKPKDVKMSLIYNEHGRHISEIVDTWITSNASPFLVDAKPNTKYPVAVSHGEGRLVLEKELYEKMNHNAQVFSRYATNVNGSMHEIEGIVSPSGQILGKMGHVERRRSGLPVNEYNENYYDIFKNAVNHLRGE